MAITTQMRTDVSQLYVGLFGRAPDGDGLGYWVQQLNAGQSMTQIADTMYATAPARVYFPSFLTNGEIIASFYQNVLGRPADLEGAAFWTGKLNAPGATPGSVIAELINVVANYGGTDTAGLISAALFNNRVAVAQWYGEQNGAIAGATTILSGVTFDPATVTAATSGSVTNGQTFTLTNGVDTLVGSTGNDTFTAGETITPIADGLGGVANSTVAHLGALDSIDGGAGTDTLNVTTTAAFTVPASATVKNIEIANIKSGADVNGDVSGWTGLTTLNVTSSAAAAIGESVTAATTTAVTVTNSTGKNVSVIGGGNTASVTTGAAGAITIGKAGGGAGGAADANAFTSVSIKGGTSSFVTDNSGTTGAVGTTLTTVSLDNTALVTTLNGNAIANVTAANEAATASVVITNAATAAQTLNLTVNNNAAGFQVIDASAKTVNVVSSGTKATSVDLTIVAATTLNTSGSADLTLGTTTEAYTALTTLNIANTGKFTADLSAANTPSAANLTSIVATTSTGANTLAIDATKTSYAGGSGVDTITIAAAPTKVIDGGAGTADVLVENIAGGYNASANTKITGFETLGLGALADASAYDATGFLHLTTGTTANASSFTNVAAGVDLTFTATNANVISYSLANATGLTDSASVALTSAAGISDKLTATGVENINITATNTTAGTTGAVAIMDTLLLSAAPTGAATNAITITSGALTGVTLTDLTDTKISSVNASGVQGDGAGTANTGFIWTTGALAATTATTATAITGSANGGDNINASAALDLITITATKGTNTLVGSATNKSTITGGSGADIITGGSAADTIVGGGGADVITGGAGADNITVSGNTAKIVQGIAASGTNTSTTIQTAELTSTFDVIKGLVAGDKIDLGNTNIATAQLTLAGANLASAGDNVAVFASGTYDAAAGTFTYAANGADTALTYDSTTAVGTTTAETVILVGYHAASTTAATVGVITLA